MLNSNKFSILEFGSRIKIEQNSKKQTAKVVDFLNENCAFVKFRNGNTEILNLVDSMNESQTITWDIVEKK